MHEPRSCDELKQMLSWIDRMPNGTDQFETNNENYVDTLALAVSGVDTVRSGGTIANPAQQLAFLKARLRTMWRAAIVLKHA